MKPVLPILGVLTAVVAVSPAKQGLVVGCNEILRYGIFDVQSSSSSLRYDESVAYMFFNKDQRNWMAKGKAVVEGVPLGGSADWSKSSETATSYRQNRSLRAEQKEFVRQASSEIVNAWSRCMGRKGLSFSLEQLDSLPLVRGHVEFHSETLRDPPPSSGTIQVPAESFKAGSCRCESSPGVQCSVAGSEITYKMPSGSKFSFVCARQTRGGLYARMQSERGPDEARLPALELETVFRPTSSLAQPQGKCVSTAGVIDELQLSMTAFEVPEDEPISIIGVQATGLGSKSVTLKDFPVTLENLRLSVAPGPIPSPRPGLYIKLGAQDSIQLINLRKGAPSCKDGWFQNYRKVTIMARVVPAPKI